MLHANGKPYTEFSHPKRRCGEVFGPISSNRKKRRNPKLKDNNFPTGSAQWNPPYFYPRIS